MRENHRPQAAPGRAQAADLPPLEPDLAALAAGLEELAQAERGAAPPGLSHRVFEASRAHLTPLRQTGVVARIGPPPAGRRMAILTPLRAAAALALASAVVLVIVAGRSGPVPRHAAIESAALESEVTEWLALSDGIMGDLAAQIDGLDADSATLREKLAADLSVSDLFSDEGAF